MSDPTPEDREALVRAIYTNIAFRGGDDEHFQSVRGSMYDNAADAVIAAGWRPPVSVPEDLAEAIDRVKQWARLYEANRGVWGDRLGVSYPSAPLSMTDIRTLLAAAEVSSRPVPDTEDDRGTGAEYGFVPDGPLLNMAEHSTEQVSYWEQAVSRAHEDVERAERMLAHWTSERDDQYHALDERDMLAPVTPQTPEPCEWCEKPHRGFAEWQGDGLAHPSCGEHGFGFIEAAAARVGTTPGPADPS